MANHTRYTRAACGHCRQSVWLSNEDAPASASSASVPPARPCCRRCNLNLSDPASKCSICLDWMCDPFRFSNLSNESWDRDSCGHRFCKECLRQYARSKLDDGVWSLRCPEVGCSQPMLDQDLVRLLLGTFAERPRPRGGGVKGAEHEEQESHWTEGRKLLQRYRDLKSAEHGAHLKAVLRALADKSDSESSEGGSFDRAGLGQPGSSKAAEDSFEGWAASACQACPCCLIIVRKDEGCDHMQCRCGSHFCFGCGAPYDKADGCICRTLSRKDGEVRLASWLRATGRLLEL